MRDAFVAAGVSLLVHALLCAVLTVGLGSSPELSDTAASLDLASVEIGFAERGRQDAAEAAEVTAGRRTEPRDGLVPPPSDVPAAAGPPSPVPPRPSLDSGLRPAEILEMEAADDLSVPSPSSEAEQAHVEAPPRPSRSIRPVYPLRARQRREEGDVTLQFSVSETGLPGQVRVVVSSGSADLDGAAERAVRSARFEPAKRGLAPVASTVRQTLSFRLR